MRALGRVWWLKAGMADFQYWGGHGLPCLPFSYAYEMKVTRTCIICSCCRVMISHQSGSSWRGNCWSLPHTKFKMNSFPSWLSKFRVRLLPANSKQSFMPWWWMRQLTRQIMGKSYLYDALVAHEEFVGLYLTDSITSEALVVVIKNKLVRLNLKFQYCCGQCYDGASSMCNTR